MPTPKTPVQKKPKPQKYKTVPTALSKTHIEDIDAIAKAEGISRSEVVRKAVEAYAINYKTDRLDQRQIQLEKRMKTMETALRALLVKSIRINGQLLYFATIPYTMGVPKRRLSQKGFQLLYDQSTKFAGQLLESRASGRAPKPGESTETAQPEQQSQPIEKAE